MSDARREAWTKLIRPEDYETHMAAVGQAQANAKLVENYFRVQPIEANSSILFLGAGTGQMFQFVSPAFLLPFEITFTDINPTYLKWLSERLRSTTTLRYTTTVDDLENSQLGKSFSLLVAVLVLEHVDWRAAVAHLAKLAQDNILIVLQENPSPHSTAINASRRITGTMNVLVHVHPQLVPRQELVSELGLFGFASAYYEEKLVADGKKMLALGFQRKK